MTNTNIPVATLLKVFVLQSKGGVGKSYITKLFALKAEKEKRKTYFIDTDNSSSSTTLFFNNLGDRKSEFTLFKSFNLLGSDLKVDRTKLDSFLATVEKLDNVVVDFGAESSQQFLNYLKEEQKNDIVNTLKELGITIYLVVAGGAMTKETVDFALELKKVKGIEKIVKVVANEKEKGVGGQSVKEFTKADIQITSLHEDANSEAQIEWNDMLAKGVVYSDIEAMSIIRKKRIMSYLDSIFVQLT